MPSAGRDRGQRHIASRRGDAGAGPSHVEGRFEALRLNASTTLVGRDEELEILRRRWRSAAAGEGRVVLLSGEPGIGKSRLVVEIQRALRDEDHDELRFHCSPHRAESALQPVLDYIERTAGFAAAADPDRKRRLLEAMLAESRPSVEDVDCLAAMLSLPTPDRGQAIEASAHRRKHRSFALLFKHLEHLASRRPVLLLFEDVHWIDATSLELLDLIVERAADIPLLAVVTFRPEFRAPWLGRPHVTALTLSRLGRADARALVARIAGERDLPAEVLDQIVQRSDGVPLFAEEVTKAVLESDALGERAAGEAPPASSVLIPASLQDALMARLDRLSAVKEIAQVGANIGREFSRRLVGEALRMSSAALDDGLTRLTEAGLLYRRGSADDATYVFKHALIRDAAYDSQLKTRARTGIVASPRPWSAATAPSPRPKSWPITFSRGES